jgi:DNA repair protein RadC
MYYYQKITLSMVREGIPSDIPHKINNSGDANKVARMVAEREKYDLNLREYFFALHFNRRNKLIGFNLVSMGGMNSTVVDPKLIFAPALQQGAHALVLVHNHPSGETQPSGADEGLTRRMKMIGEALEMNILDHVILGEGDSYFSFADNGII